MATRTTIPVPPDDGRAPFLAAIRANPADDAPRLVFADWLEERGDEVRAKFIRLQIEQARLDKHNPRIGVLSRQLRPLEASVRSATFRGLPRAWFRSASFSRGFLERLWTTTELFLRGGPALLAREPLYQLDVRNGRNSLAASIVRSPLLLQIPALAITHSRLGSEGAELIARSPNVARLQSLDLTANYILTDGVIRLAESPHLGNLRSLTLKFNDAFEQGATAIARSPHLANLTYLDIGCNEIGPRGLAGLAASLFAHRLETLKLEGNPSYEPLVRDDGMRELVALKAFPQLRELDLQENEITAQGLHELAQASHWKQLRQLSLQGNTLEGHGIEHLARAPFLKTLQELNLQSTFMGDRGAAALGQMQAPQLRTLNLNSCGITAARINDFCAGSWRNNLVELSLDHNLLNNQGVAAMVNGIAWPQLAELSLRSVGMRFLGAKALAKANLPQLRRLALNYNRIPSTGLVALAKAAWWQHLCTLECHNIDINVQAATALANIPATPYLEFVSCSGNIPDESAQLLKKRFGKKIRIN